jgi:hypothetical protein
MPDDREPYGRLVHEQRRAWIAAHPGKFYAVLWEERDSGQRELDMRIGAAVAAAERERIRELADRNNAVCVGDEGTSCYFADLIREPQERSDEKEPS